MTRRLTLPQLKKYDVTQKVVSMLADAESRTILFSIVNLSRHININPEVALDKSILKFIKRFKALEDYFKKKKLNIEDQSQSDLDEIWNKIKKLT